MTNPDRVDVPAHVKAAATKALRTGTGANAMEAELTTRLLRVEADLAELRMRLVDLHARCPLMQISAPDGDHLYLVSVCPARMWSSSTAEGRWSTRRALRRMPGQWPRLWRDRGTRMGSRKADSAQIGRFFSAHAAERKAECL
jgi:hypothetical protein